nr:gliding motility-associated C-terminal domain-containing protein [Spirosomataceae bacterium]
MPPPKVSSPAQLTVFKGESIEIKTGIPTDATVRWFPSAGLDDATAPRPQASPDRTTIYTLTVTTREGCVVEADVTVEVIELKIPNGFTPNADGANDTWEIEGIQKYPNCTI